MSCALALAVVLSGAARPAPVRDLPGFASSSATRERAVEAAFASIPSPERAREWHRTFTAEPHPAGSERNHELALFIAEEWRKQGLEDVVIHRYDVLNTAPLEVSLTMVAPVRYEASLREEPVDADPDTRNPRVSPGYLGLSVVGRRRGARRLRPQRQPRGLRGPPEERHRRAGQDRPRPLLEPLQLPRLQGPHRGAAGSGGHPHLLRPRGGRLQAGAGLP